MGRTLHDELAGGLGELVGAEPTEAIFNNSRYTGVVVSQPEQTQEMLDAGYEARIEFEWMVTADELQGARPQKRDKLTIGGTEYRIASVTGRPISDPKHYKFGVQQINT